MRTPLFRRLAATAAAPGLSSLGLLGAGAAPARAAVSDCPTGYFCAWANTDSTGSMSKTQSSKATLGTWDDKFRLIINRTPGFACTFDEPNYEDAAGRYGNDGYSTGIASRSVSSVKIVRTIRECEGPAYPHWLAETSPEAAGFGDMNGDGRADLYAREASTGKLWLYPGRAGALGSRVLVGSGGWNGMPTIIANGDWSGDGRPDLIATRADDGMLYRYPGTGSGGLGAGDWLGGGDWRDLNGAF